MGFEHTPVRLTTSVEAAAKALGIGRNQAYAAAARGELPVIRIGKRLLVPIAALERLLHRFEGPCPSPQVE
jgi:excisionase family DNA binding protein